MASMPVSFSTNSIISTSMPKYQIGETIYFIKDDHMMKERICGIILVEENDKENSFYYAFKTMARFSQLYRHQMVKEDVAFPTKEALIEKL